VTTTQSQAPAPARTPTEAELLAIWTGALGRPPVSTEADLFAAGADSIAVVGLLARACTRFGADVSLQSLLVKPTIAALAARVDAALATGAEAAAGPSPLTPGQAPVLSHGQERFWFIDQASDSNPVSNVAWALRLRGELNPSRLAGALRALALRHDALRMSFAAGDGRPVAVVESGTTISMALMDLSAAQDPEAEATAYAVERALEPFDLSRGPLLRAELITLGADENVLLFVAHHVICDDWTKGVIMSELSALYADPKAALDTPVQFPAYAAWERERLSPDRLAAELQHWREALAGAPPATELPADRPRPPAPSLRGARLRTSVDPDLAAAVAALGREQGATLFMTMLAALAVLLQRYSGQDEVVVGTAIDVRPHPSLDSAVGLYTNVLALRADASGDPSFRTLLARVRDRTLDAIAHRELPFDRLAAVAPDRDPSRHPVFQVFYEFVVPARLELSIEGVTSTPFEIPKHTSEFDLGLYLDQQRGGLDAVWEYATDLFEAATIERMAGHYLTLLAAVVADPDRPVGGLELLDPGERRRALRDWNQTSVDVEEACIDELFERHARRDPDAIALVDAAGAHSYGELNRRANRIAWLLRGRGVGAGACVGLCLGRNADLIAAMLGILKAGAGYVPLNPDHPAARLAAQIRTAGAAMLVAGRGDGLTALPDVGVPVLWLDELTGELEAAAAADPERVTGPNDLAYVLYTSGSTGVPKGVAVTHRNLVNYARHMIGALADGDARGIAFASVSAVSTDLGNTAIFPALAGGGCLHLVPTEIATDAALFAEHVARNPVDVLKITPSHLAALLEGGDVAAALPRRWLVLGGEALTWPLADRVLIDRGPRVMNHYGPTEATVGCCTYEVVRGAPRPPAATVPIGRPISNARAYVLDAGLEPVPVGVPGQLYVAGAGVARGYINAPDQTAAAFVTDPFAEPVEGASTAGVMYRTGDLVRRLADGSIEFLGRADEQIKIRGYRVEPAEVQAVLSSQAGVGQAAVAVAGQGDGRQLVAYVVLEPGVTSPERLREALVLTLPSYMVPSAIFTLDALPLTPNGKLDRARLPAAPAVPPAGTAPASDRLAHAASDRLATDTSGTADQAPVELETALAAIWSELLEHRVGPDDNFFEAGGHSLLAIRMVARIRSEFGVKLGLKRVIDAPTVRELAQRIAAAQGQVSPQASDNQAAPPATGPTPPESDTVARLAAVWSELLEHEVGPEDNFFEAGGHSLLAIRMVARIRSELGVKLSLKKVIDAPTVRGLAGVIDAAAEAAETRAPDAPPAPGAPPAPALEPPAALVAPARAPAEPAGGRAPAITLVPRGRPLRASFAQEQFWLVDRLAPGSAAYNFSWPTRLTGPLDVAALEAAIAELVARHEPLRTRFVSADGEPMQVIDPPGGIALHTIDVSQAADPESAARQLIDRQTTAPFDLAEGPLLRVQLLALGPDDHILQIVVHHAVFDGVSKVVLYRELSECYAAFAAGRPSPLEPLRAQYADYAQWQAAELSEALVAEELDHWRAALAGIPTALELPSDRPRPAVASMRGDRHRVSMPPDLRSDLERLARAERTTFFMVVMTLFVALLHRYGGQEEVIVGTPVDTRSRAELEQMVGPFINTVVIRGELAGDPSFRELLGRIQERTLDAIEHKELPFERLVEALAPERDLSRHPVYQALLALNPPEKGLQLPGIEARELDPDWSSARVDLFLIFDDLPHGLDAVWEYSTDLFDASTIERMGEHFVALARAAITDPSRPIGQLNMLRETDRTLLLSDWNRTDADFPDARLERLVADVAAAAPERVAVEYAGRSLTYGELERRANRLANRLIALGVGVEDLVGICLERSEQLPVALLGTMKTGGAYVPIDPTFPAARQRFMLGDAQVKVLITEEPLLGWLPVDRAEVLCLDRDAAQIEAESETPPPDPSAGPDGLAYVIYTSGSTGAPKGVEIEHRALINFLTTMAVRPGLAADDVLVAVTTLSFDIAGLELYLPLIVGARVVIAGAQTASDPRALARLLEGSGATVMQATPTTWRMLLDDGWSGASARGGAGLKALCGGEALPPGLRDQLIAAGVELWNMYGPTETTIWSTIAPLRTAGERLTIGRPIANTALYVLDEGRQPTPIGVPGELYIGGVGLARGYRHRVELTAERFLPDPFSGRPGARMYRTGDLASFRPDGSVEYLGRADQQIKLRGYRIELGEIEATLARQPGVSAAAARVHAGAGSEPTLVGYVVAEGQPLDGEELRRLLGQSLPGYMVPATIIALESLPLTPNAKLDRKALPAPSTPARAAATRIPVRTDTERALADLWSEVLGVGEPDAGEDFFALGGQSLLAARLVSRIDSRFGIELPLRALFESPTIAGLAARIDAVTGTAAAPAEAPALAPSTPSLLAAARTRPTSFAQERFWFIDQLSRESAAYNISWPLRLRGALDVVALERAVQEVVRRHEVLRTRFADEAGRPVQVIDPAGTVAVEFLDLSSEPDPDARAQALVDERTQTPFDLETGPLLRVTVLRLGQADHVLQLVVHHIAADGASRSVLFGELGALYAALLDNRPAALAPLPLQYADYAEWQRAALGPQRLERELKHWQTVLAGMPSLLELPSDRPRPAISTLQGAWIRSRVDAELLQGVAALARSEGSTLFMAMLAAYLVLLHRYSGQDEIAVGTPVDTRGRPELEPLIGPFVNTVVLRGDLSSEPSFRDLLGRVQASTLDAIDHQELPFERLVAALAPDRDLGRHPLFQAMFALHDEAAPIELEGLHVQELQTEKTAARVDLTLLLTRDRTGLDAVWEYSSDLFDPASIEQLARHFENLLRAIVADPDRPVASLALLDQRERQRLIQQLNQEGTEDPYPVAALNELFEAQVTRTAGAVAVVYESESLTYAELNARANRLAHRLIAAGVHPDTPVALCLERSLELVVAILAVLKAGGGYVPLDPAYPPERLEFVLADCGAPVVVTQERLLERLAGSAALAICIDRDAAEIAAQSDSDPAPAATPESLAYVIYTSGSTGHPKGVPVEHRNVARLFSATNAWFRPSADDTWTLLHSYAFDFSVWELWGALLHGGRLVIVPSLTARAPDALAALLVQTRVTVLNVTPSLFVTAIDELLSVGDQLALRLVIFGGEALHTRLLAPWYARFGDTGPELVNMYGITETTVHVTYRPLVAADAARDGSPIGRPIPDLRLYLLDGRLEPVPPGVSGELFVGGAGVARGYLNRPQLTEQRFLDNPFADGRLYRSGDRARWVRGLGLMFEGRLDDQVKIRGFRIELGEIQSALAEHAAVSESAVVADSSGPGDARLVAYVVPADPAADIGELTAALRVWLAAKLPEHMVPASFTTLPALPLTANGKLDRRALPKPVFERGAVVAPRTPVERRLAEHWAELLEVGHPSVDQSFFELGGHSLLAAQLAARIRASLEPSFSVRSVFETPTIAGLAGRIEALRVAPGEAAAPDDGAAELTAATPLIRPPTPRAAGASWPLSHSQRQLWLIDQWDPGAPTYNVTLAFRARGELNVKALGDALTALVAHHEALRTVVRVIDDEPRPALIEDPQVELELIDLTGVDPGLREQEALARLEQLARRPFQLASDLLLRAAVIEFGDRDRIIAIATHHIAFDGWSEKILFEDLASLYQGHSPPLPELQFGDFALWDRERLSGAEMEEELRWWRGHLAGAPTTIALPADHVRPEGRRFAGASHEFQLGAEVADGIRALWHSNGATPYMVVLAALATTLYRITGQDDVLVGSPAANRSSVRLERTIGFVSNTLVFRARLSGNPTFEQLLDRVREMALDVYTHQGLPFEKLVEALSPEREAGVNPLFQVNLRVANARRSTLALPGIEVTAIKVDSGFSRFDLALDVDVLDEGISGYFRYNRELFESETIARIAAEFTTVLTDAVAEPQRTLLAFELQGDWSSVRAAPATATAGLRNFRRRGQDRAGTAGKD
jgi:amino acid adenylation domain-containing protein